MALLKKTLIASVLAACMAGPLHAVIGSSVQPIVNTGQVLYGSNVKTITSSSTVTIDTTTAKLTVKDIQINGVCTGSGCGGGGGSSSLAVNQNGTQITSPTVALNALAPPFKLTAVGSGTTAQFNLDGSSVTLQGNAVTFGMVGLSTASLQTQISATAVTTGTLATSITALGVSTGSLQTQISATAITTGTLKTSIINLGASTGTLSVSITNLGVSTGSLQAQITATAVSTQSVAAAVGLTTASLQVQITATGVATGTLAGNFPVSLSTNVVNTLADVHLSTNVALLNSTNTWNGGNTFLSTSSFNNDAVIGSSTTNRVWNFHGTQNLYRGNGGGMVLWPETGTGLPNSLSFESGNAGAASSLQNDCGGSSACLNINAAAGIEFNNSFGNSGQFLESQGFGSPAVWAPVPSGGVSVYPATATASFPFGFSASTTSFNAFNSTISSMTATGISGLTVVSTMTAGSYAGGGLTSCSGISNALTWTAATDQFGCNTISGSGGGGASTLAVGTGISTQFTNQVSSPTQIISANNAQFTVSLQGGATAFMSVNLSSITAQGNTITFTGLQTQITATAVSTQSVAAAVGLTTASLQVQITATGVSTGTLQTQITATGVTTGTLAGNFPVSLSTNVAGNLGVTHLNSGTNADSSHFWRGDGQWISSSTFSGGTTTGSPFSLAITTGGPNSFSGVAISSSNSTTEILFDSATTRGVLLPGGTYFFTLNPSSVTLQGVVTAASLGALTANQTITLSGDSSGSGATAITVTAAGTQTNITKINPAATLLLGSSGQAVQVSSNAILGATTIYASGVISGASLATTELSGTLQAAQFPALTGDITTAGGSLATTAAATQTNITKISPAATLNLGSNANFVQISSNAVLPGATFYQNGTTVLGASGFALTISSNVILPGATFFQGGTQTFTNPLAVTNGGTGTTTPGLVAGTNITSITGTWPNQTINAASGGTGVSVYPATATASFPFGMTASTLALVNSTTANTLTISTSATGVNIVSVSSSIAVSPYDFQLSVATPTAAGGLLFGVQLSGHVISSGTVPTIGSCGTSPSVNGQSTDEAGAFTWGGAATSCVLTFGIPYVSAPFCVGASTASAVGVTAASGSSVTLSFPSVVGSTITYQCSGGRGG